MLYRYINRLTSHFFTTPFFYLTLLFFIILYSQVKRGGVTPTLLFFYINKLYTFTSQTRGHLDNIYEFK